MKNRTTICLVGINCLVASVFYVTVIKPRIQEPAEPAPAPRDSKSQERVPEKKAAAEAPPKSEPPQLQETQPQNTPPPVPAMTTTNEKPLRGQLLPQSDEFRTWTDASGGYTIEAKYAGTAFGKVQLKKKDGSKVVVPMEQLSDADRDWIQKRSR